LYPKLITMGRRVTLSVRVTIVAHFGTDSGVVLEDDVFVGPNVTILPGVTIGRGSVITAGTVVNRSVPPQTIVQGNPGKFVATCSIPLTNNTPTHEFARGLKPIKRRSDSRPS
jgi:acetyltransferase-like isoleucine patch superfamily enzyme